MSGPESRLSMMLKSHHSPLNLLVAHKHHNVPGDHAKKRSHEATKRIRRWDEALRLTGSYWRHLPFIKRWGSFFNHHGEGTVYSTAVLPWYRVHEAGFHHVHRRRYKGGAESSGEGCGEVTRHVVCGGNHRVVRFIKTHTDWRGTSRRRAPTCHQVVLQDEIFDDVIRDQLGAVYHGVTSYVQQTAWKKIFYTINQYK